MIPLSPLKSLADCMEICLIDSLIGYQGNWFSDKASKLSSTSLPSWNSGMSQWYVTYWFWQKPQARPTIPNLFLTCSENAKPSLKGSMIFPWSSVSYPRPSHGLFYFRTSNQNFWCAHMPSVHFWKNSPMLTGWNTPECCTHENSLMLILKLACLGILSPFGLDPSRHI